MTNQKIALQRLAIQDTLALKDHIFTKEQSDGGIIFHLDGNFHMDRFGIVTDFSWANINIKASHTAGREEIRSRLPDLLGRGTWHDGYPSRFVGCPLGSMPNHISAAEFVTSKEQ